MALSGSWDGAQGMEYPLQGFGLGGISLLQLAPSQLAREFGLFWGMGQVAEPAFCGCHRCKGAGKHLYVVLRQVLCGFGGGGGG